MSQFEGKLSLGLHILSLPLLALTLLIGHHSESLNLSVLYINGAQDKFQHTVLSFIVGNTF